jgi:hypothetical protein
MFYTHTVPNVTIKEAKSQLDFNNPVKISGSNESVSCPSLKSGDCLLMALMQSSA